MKDDWGGQPSGRKKKKDFLKRAWGSKEPKKKKGKRDPWAPPKKSKAQRRSAQAWGRPVDAFGRPKLGRGEKFFDKLLRRNKGDKKLRDYYNKRDELMEKKVEEVAGEDLSELITQLTGKRLTGGQFTDIVVFVKRLFGR